MVEQADIRRARLDDHDGVTRLCADIWPDRDTEYLPEIYPTWIAGEHTETLLAARDGDILGIAQCVLLTEHEAWCQGMRVHPTARGRGLGSRLVERLFAWASEQGAIVARNMVHAWNAPGMAHSRRVGFEPVTAFRWATPEPALVSELPPLERSPAAIWHAWSTSDARSWLGGLAGDRHTTWALSECTRADIEPAAKDDGTFAIVDGGVRGMALTGASYTDEMDRPCREYAATAWGDRDAAEELLAAIRAAAYRDGLASVRVLIPETPRHVSDMAAVGCALSETPYLVFAADLLDATRH